VVFHACTAFRPELRFSDQETGLNFRDPRENCQTTFGVIARTRQAKSNTKGIMMKVAILGTGMVGQTLAGKLSEVGQDVMIGTRNAEETMSRTALGMFGNPPFRVWKEQHPSVSLGTLSQAAAYGEIVLNATSGAASLEALSLAGEPNLNGKILIDISNPLDFSRGMPPSLTVCNTDSLAEQIQRAHPRAKVVKALNTVNAMVMVSPQLVAGGDHHLFISGNDAGAKAKVVELLKSWFGWKHIIDLGDITTARGSEMVLPLWISLMGALKTPMFNFKVTQ
jgi:predicted dinucleotide-binding enzyme